MTKKNKKNVIIVGAGDVGRALQAILKKKFNVFLLDKKTKLPDEKTKISVAHICYGFDDNFIKNTVGYIKKYRPSLTIINSTIAVGTTRKIINKSKNQLIVHSPVIGDHNNLIGGIKTFTKPIGSDYPVAGRRAAKHFQTVAIKTKIFNNSKTTELGKLLLTTQYALNIAFHQEMERICRKTKTNFKETVSEMKKIYNAGYKKLRPNVTMSELFPGKIGGKCLMPNLEILKQCYSSGFIELIKKSNKEKTNEESTSANKHFSTRQKKLP